MGLKKSLDRASNTVKGIFPESYWKISNIRLENGKIMLDVRAYCDQDARKLDTSDSSNPMMPGMTGDIKISNKNFNFAEGLLPAATLQTMSESARLKHCCYLYLKSIDEFRNAVDVFESGQNVSL